MRTTGVRKGKGNEADADTVSVQWQQTTLSSCGHDSTMSNVRAVLSSQCLVFVTVLVICVDCAEFIDKEIPDVKQTLDNGKDKNITFLVTTVNNGQNSTHLIVSDHNSVSGSTQLQPETEEDLVSEMEELFKAMQLLGLDFDRNATDGSVSARMKMSDFMFNPVMLVPQLIMWGFAPIILANLKMFVMQALMLNKMALNAAIFMTLRNIVFGPRPGPIVKYANHGYQHSPVHHHHHRRS